MSNHSKHIGYPPLTSMADWQPSAITQPPEQAVDQQPNMAVLAALIALIFVLSCIFLCLIFPPLYRYVKSRVPVDPKRVEARYVTIEGWLISKRVRVHDEKCPCLAREKGEASGDMPQLKPSSSYDTAETACEPDNGDESIMGCGTGIECPICMSELEEDEIASWSFADHCAHVYHHECIKEWLLRHSNCPFCREVYMPVDREARLTKLSHQQLTIDRAQRMARTFICQRGGLVTLDFDESKDEVTWRQLTCPNVKKDELTSLRKGLKIVESARDAENHDSDVMSLETESAPQLASNVDSIDNDSRIGGDSSDVELGRVEAS